MQAFFIPPNNGEQYNYFLKLLGRQCIICTNNWDWCAFLTALNSLEFEDEIEVTKIDYDECVGNDYWNQQT